MTLVCDLTHYAELAAAPAPVVHMADFLRDVICAATSLPQGEGALLPCRHESCTGPVLAGPAERGEPLPWVCVRCEDRGEVWRWEQSPWDAGHRTPRLRVLRGGEGSGPSARLLGGEGSGPAARIGGEGSGPAARVGGEGAGPAAKDRPLHEEEVRAALAKRPALSLLRRTAALLDALGGARTVAELEACRERLLPDDARALTPKVVRRWPGGPRALVAREPDGRLRLRASAPALCALRQQLRARCR